MMGPAGATLPSAPVSVAERRGGAEWLLLLPVVGCVEALTRSLAGHAGLEVPALAALGTSLAATVAAALLLFHPLVCLGLAALAAAAFGGLYHWYPAALQPLWSLTATLAEAWRQWEAGEAQAVAQCVPAVLTAAALISLALALIIATLAVRRREGAWVLIAGTVLLATQWSFYYEPAGAHLALFLVCALTLTAGNEYLRRRRQWHRWSMPVRGRPLPGTLLCTVALATVIVGAATLGPTQFSAWNLAAVGDRLVRLFPVLERARGPEGGGAVLFSLESAGLGDSEQELGGPADLNRRPALRLTLSAAEARRLHGQTLHLRGVIMDKYTGRGWVRTDRADERHGDAALLGGGYHRKVHTTTARYTLCSVGPRTASLFAALQPVEARLEVGGSAIFSNSADMLIAWPALGPGEPYEVVSELPLVSLEQARNLCLEARPWPEPEEDDPLLQLPPSLPGRVRDLARRAAGGYDNPLDRALALEAYLRSIPYTLDSPRPPLGREFVDYFLFDLRRGYCTYHSTAMAVMLRTLDIRSRWVEGYTVSVGVGQGVYEITGVRAHAWVEAYIPGYGWLTFEPTPSADLPRRDYAIPADSGGSGSGDDSAGGPAADGSGGREDEPGFHEPEDNWYLGPGIGGDGLAPRRLAGGLAAGLVLILALWLVWAVIRTRRAEVVGLGDPATAVCRYYELSRRLLDRFGTRADPSHTPLEWKQVAAAAAPDVADRLDNLVNCYNHTRYGGHRPGRAQALEARGCYWGLVRYLRQHRGTLDYWRRRLG